MAIEYRLAYTAQEIDRKLRKIDEIDNKQDKLAFDSAPTEGSENLVKSGDIHAALQNVKLDAGNLVEIKDGVISSTLGTTVPSTNKIELVNVPNLPQAEDADGVYDTYFEHSYVAPEVGDIVNVELLTSNSENFITFNDIEVLRGGEGSVYLAVNTLMDLDTAVENGLTKINDDLPAFFVFLFVEEGEIDLLTWEDYTNSTLIISKQEIVSSHVKLPNEALSFDEVPTEGSENLVTSGSVYKALQNVGGENGGNVDLTAGDLIEIKDGVIRSTLGDCIGTETESSFIELYHIDNIEMGDQEDGTYAGGIEFTSANPIDLSQKLILEFELPDGTIKSFSCDIISEYNEEEGMIFISGLDNYGVGDEGLFKIDENLAAIYFEGGIYGEEWSCAFVTSEDYNGASLTVAQGGVEERNIYVTLPENALIAGNLIKIENGVISSTLGDKVVSTKELDFFNIDTIPSDCYDDGQTMYSGESDGIPTAGGKVNIEITLANSDTPILFNEIEVMPHDTACCFLVNSNQTVEDFDSNGIVKQDENLPAMFCLMMEEDGIYYYTIISDDDITGASVKASGVSTTTHVIKIPNTALNFDEKPQEDSKNLVNSGAIYTAIHNVKKSIVCDNVPTPLSSNFMSSGAIYNALFQSETKVKSDISNHINSIIVGEKGSADGAEIFNNYHHNKAMGDYSHAEGSGTKANGISSHAEGSYTTASGDYSHAEGSYTTASGDYSHAEGSYTTASGNNSHAEGIYTTASGNNSHVEGKYNIEDNEGKYAHIVGNGTGVDTLSRSNAHTLDWEGNAWFAGYVEGNAIILPSSTSGSTKRFKITVDDSGTLSATEV